MARFTDILKDGNAGEQVAARMEDYKCRYDASADGGGVDRRNARAGIGRRPTTTWLPISSNTVGGPSFHFAPRAPGESFAASIARHEHYLAHRLSLGPGMTAVDLGCGIGGPLIEIARFSGARIVGEAPPGVPWYQPFVGGGLSFASFRSSPVGRRVTSGSLRLLEGLGIVPRGAARVARLLNLAAAAFAEAGRLGIFKPMYFFLARKPE